MNIAKFLDKKDSGLTSVTEENSVFTISYARFNSETGEPMQPDTETITVAELVELKNKYQDEVDRIDEVITHLQSIS